MASLLTFFLIASSFAVFVFVSSEDAPCVVDRTNQFPVYDSRLEEVSHKNIEPADVVQIKTSTDLKTRVCAHLRFKARKEECKIVDYKTENSHSVSLNCYSI